MQHTDDGSGSGPSSKVAVGASYLRRQAHCLLYRSCMNYLANLDVKVVSYLILTFPNKLWYSQLIKFIIISTLLTEHVIPSFEFLNHHLKTH